MSDDHNARLNLPYLAAGQMQKHVTLNEALTRLDALVQTVVASRTVAAQPAAPVDGVLHLQPAAATGSAWAGRSEGTLMRAEGGGWSAGAPAPLRGCAPPLLDEEAWSVPDRLSDDDLYAAAGPNGPRPTRTPDDLEEDQ